MYLTIICIQGVYYAGMLTLSQFDYQLPERLIAQTPAEPRDHSRLLVLNKNTGNIHHDHFYNILRYLRPGDVLVRNNSKVIKARLIGKKDSGGAVEVLLNRQLSSDDKSVTWEALTKPGLKPGQNVSFEKDGVILKAACTGLTDDKYARVLVFNSPTAQFFEKIAAIGEVPLPPYIASLTSEKIAEQYQTTYAQHQGSVAAPTAGLHFTPELDTQLQALGVEIVEVTLHVGMGTFLPVKSEDVTQHVMHEEVFSVSAAAAEKLNAAKAAGQRIIAVGTTTTRVLETLANQDGDGKINAGSGSTDIYIYPPYQFKFVDGLITNFHLPKSTLLMLVSALVSGPNTETKFTDFQSSAIGKAYLEAIKEEYRFFSFGDGMLII